MEVVRNCWSAYESDSEYSKPCSLTSGTNNSWVPISTHDNGTSWLLSTHPPKGVQPLNHIRVLPPRRDDGAEVRGDSAPYQVYGAVNVNVMEEQVLPVTYALVPHGAH